MLCSQKHGHSRIKEGRRRENNSSEITLLKFRENFRYRARNPALGISFKKTNDKAIFGGSSPLHKAVDNKMFQLIQDHILLSEFFK